MSVVAGFVMSSSKGTDFTLARVPRSRTTGRRSTRGSWSFDLSNAANANATPDRQPIVLYYFQEMDLADAGPLLGYAVATTLATLIALGVQRTVLGR
jgi:hypothetical protein